MFRRPSLDPSTSSEFRRSNPLLKQPLIPEHAPIHSIDTQNDDELFPIITTQSDSLGPAYQTSCFTRPSHPESSFYPHEPLNRTITGVFQDHHALPTEELLSKRPSVRVSIGSLERNAMPRRSKSTKSFRTTTEDLVNV